MASTEHLHGDKYKIYVELGTDDYGTRKRRTKTVTATSARDLKKKALEFELECLNTPIENLETIKFNRFVDRWWSNHVQQYLTVGTQNNYSNHLKHVREYFGNMQLRKIKRFHIDEFFINEKNCGRKSETTKVTMLQSIFGKAVEWDILLHNPTQRYKLKHRTQPKKADVYTAEELELFFKLLDTEKTRNRIMLLAASLGALRRGEVLGIAEDVIDYKNNTITIKRSLNYDETKKEKYLGLPKGKKERVIVYPEEFMRELKLFAFSLNEKRYQHGDLWEKIDGVDLLFRTQGKVMHPNYFSQMWKKACGRMGLRVINLHSLRHSSATYLHRQGMDIKALQEFLGHAKYETTANTYVHVEESDMHKPADTFTKLL
ncbi:MULTISPECIES: site-specific integrase [unclassified Sporosarcina]|uniref:tyrosine-type recombinase/integrase n=1 Tax=unclassified Sporosarcina TaxID=2647733 RepID=UPI00203D2352|nr:MULTISPECIES: site-specific integrase [unclassified Sporosarcina]GKV65464.1 site-specific integrase [Sporosarcina sp. NCCP-2331]GLB55588.1 site-specific integrase [Sporosarcina sp. NCCP-2378]